MLQTVPTENVVVVVFVLQPGFGEHRRVRRVNTAASSHFDTVCGEGELFFLLLLCAGRCADMQHTQLVVMWQLTAPSCERQRRSADSSRGILFLFPSPLFLYSEQIVTRTAAVWSLNRTMIAHEGGNVLTFQPPRLPAAQSKNYNVPALNPKLHTSDLHCHSSSLNNFM